MSESLRTNYDLYFKRGTESSGHAKEQVIGRQREAAGTGMPHRGKRNQRVHHKGRRDVEAASPFCCWDLLGCHHRSLVPRDGELGCMARRSISLWIVLVLRKVFFTLALKLQPWKCLV